MSPTNDISNISKRYSLTLLHPSSFHLSLIFSVIVSSLLVVVTSFGYFDNSENIFLTLGLVISVLLVTQYIDSRFTKKKEYSKSLHMSLFGNILWLLTIVAGLISVSIFSKDLAMPVYITEGMFLFASFRIGISTSVLGIRLTKSWLFCFIQPLTMFLVLVPQDMWFTMLTDFQAVFYGVIFIERSKALEYC